MNMFKSACIARKTACRSGLKRTGNLLIELNEDLHRLRERMHEPYVKYLLEGRIRNAMEVCDNEANSLARELTQPVDFGTFNPETRVVVARMNWEGNLEVGHVPKSEDNSKLYLRNSIIGVIGMSVALSLSRIFSQFDIKLVLDIIGMTFFGVAGISVIKLTSAKIVSDDQKPVDQMLCIVGSAKDNITELLKGMMEKVSGCND